MSDSTKFEVNGNTFTAVSEIVDTDYGPENKVEFFNDKNELVGRLQEAMSTTGIIGMFKDMETAMEDENDFPPDEYDYEDTMTDAEADADTFRSCGWGTDEDYGYYGDGDY